MTQVLNSFSFWLLQWHALSKEEQAKYYELAKRERQMHMQLYPGWTARDNYAKHKKKRRKRDKVRSDEGRTVCLVRLHDHDLFDLSSVCLLSTFSCCCSTSPPAPLCCLYYYVRVMCFYEWAMY